MKFGESLMFDFVQIFLMFISRIYLMFEMHLFISCLLRLYLDFVKAIYNFYTYFGEALCLIFV